MFLVRLYIFSFLICLCGFVGGAWAERLDVSRLTHDGEFSATLGAAFKSGFNSTHTHQTDFRAGRLNELGLNMAYTPTPNLTFTFSTSNNYSDSQVGLVYKLVKNRPFKLDVLADYGIAWTKNAETDIRNGNNNVDFGARVTGVVGQRWQWAFSVLPQFVWASPDSFWNINTTSQLMYYIDEDFALRGDFEFDFVNINHKHTLYDKTLKIGLVYNLTKTASASPFVKYHFWARDFRNSFVSYYDWWQLGFAVSAQF